MLNSKIIPITDLRRNFGENTEDILTVESYILTKGGRPFAIMKAAPELRREKLMTAMGAWKGTDLDDDKLWNDVLKEDLGKRIGLNNLEMDEYFLDTSIAIDYIRGKETVSRFVNELKGRLYINYIVIAELSEGIYRVKDSKQMEVGIDNFIGGMDGVLQINYDVAKRFGKIRANLHKKGLSIEDLDLLMAATCLENNLPIITLNKKHFDRIDGLKIITPDV